jgi:hypothetical protein
MSTGLHAKTYLLRRRKDTSSPFYLASLAALKVRDLEGMAGSAEEGCTLMYSDSGISPDLLRGIGKLIGGDLNIDDEGSEQRRFEPVQSLHHVSIGYQPVRTRIGLAKKAMSMQANREHKQE